MNNIDDFCFNINEIKFNILNNEIIKINNAQLMEMYTFIYKSCIDDKSVDKINVKNLYSLHENIISSFLNDLLCINENKTIEDYILLYNKYIFFSKNINLIFRYLNKFYIIKFRQISLEIKCEYLFKEIFYHKMDSICSYIVYKESSKSYLWNENFKSSFIKLINLYKDNQLNFDNIIENIRKGLIVYYENILPTFSNINEIIFYFKRELEYQKEFINFYSLPINLEIILIDTIKKSNIQEIIDKNFNYFIFDFEILAFLFYIDYDHSIKCFNNYLETNIKNNIFIFDQILKINNVLSNLSKSLINVIPIKKILQKIITSYSHNQEFYKNLTNKIYLNKEYTFILEYINEKEVWVNVYSKKLFNRLLSNEIDLKNELSIIEYIKQYIGNSLTFKIENLIIDYKNSLLFNRGIEIDIKSSIYIYSDKSLFNDNYWKNINVKLSEPFNKAFEQIQKYYKSQYSNRLLILDYQNSSILIEAYYKNNINPYIFKMNILQYIIFNEILKGKKTHSEINSIFNIDSILLSSLLHSLINEDVLIKSGKKNKIDFENDIFTINNNFYSNKKFINIKLPLLSNKKNIENKKDELEMMFILRSYIMKIIKKKFEMTIDEIIKECYKYNNYNNTTKINEQLYFLIDKEYIEIINDKYVYIP